MKKKSEAILSLPEELPRQEASEATTQEAATEDIAFTGAFNGDSLSFDVAPDQAGTLVVELNEKPWGKAQIQSPLTVVRGSKLPATYRIRFYVQPINS